MYKRQQLRKISLALEAHGQSLTEGLVFTDSAVSAASADRPGYERLMRAVRRREIDVLVVESTSRLSGSNADSWSAWDEFTFYGVQLIGIDDGIDSARQGSKLSFGFKALINNDALDALRMMTLRGMEGAANAGHSTGGLPLGYRSRAVMAADARRASHSVVEIDPEGADVVRLIFAEYLKGQSLNAIATTLNRRGVAQPRART